MTVGSDHRQEHRPLVRPIRFRTRIYGVIGMLWGAFMVISAAVRGERISTAIVGVVFVAIAGYWVFAPNKPSALAQAGARMRAAKALEQKAASKTHEE
jgi:hypothetical protein